MANVLVVEDQVIYRKILRDSLKRAGHHVYTADNGKEALAVLETETVDLVVTDIIMPDMNGLEVMTNVRAKYPSLKIIAYSGGGQYHPRHYILPAEDLGAVKTFEKPFDIKEMLQAVNECVC